VSGSVGARAALGTVSDGDLAGLRGVGPVSAPTEPQQLGIAAVCLGIGRAALDDALSVTRSRGDRATGDPAHAPHWALADAATEIDAARLLVRSAALGLGVGAAASLVYAGGAASRAVDAALRIVGAAAYQPGSVLERCSRDIRAALLILGTEDVARRAAADTLLG
jgi:alkylation response protein AidB-like acyl-CoA dehydrogenase